MALSGIGLAYATAGGVLVWSGIKGETVAQVVGELARGKQPSGTDTQAVTIPSAPSTAAGGGGGGGSFATPTGPDSANGVAALKKAAKAHGWDTGAQWVALNYVELREAGYRLTAKNPSSGAYGMAQFINGPSEYYQYGGDPNTYNGQATAMCNYIAERYGTPTAAAAHESAYNWY